MSKFSLTTSALCALVPVTVLLAGCGGGATPSTLLGDTGSAITQTIGSFTTRLVGAAQTPVFSQGSGGAVYGLAGASITDLTQSFISKNLSNSKIAFSTFRDGNYELYTMNADGTNQTRLTNGLAYEIKPSWSPDGSKIAFNIFDGPNSDIYIMNSDGTGVLKLPNTASAIGCSWSPDGNKIVFASKIGNHFEIYTINADGTGKTQITSTGFNNVNPSWSPDGSKIAFSSTRDGNAEIYTMNPDGTNQTRLMSNTSTDDYPSWSPDSTKIIYISNAYGNSEILMMNADGNGTKRLTNDIDEDYFPSWSPDGSKIVFTSSRNGALYQIYTMNVDGTNPTQLTTNVYGASGDIQPSWSGFRRPKYVGAGGILATDCAGFLLGKKGGNAFDTSGSSAGSDSNASVLIFDTPLAARSAARITANTNTDTPGPSLAFTITTSTGLSSVKFINTTQSLGIIAPTMPAGSTGALVLFSSTTGAVTDVVPYAANRSVGSAPIRTASGDTATYTGSFPAIFDATGKNIAPSGAHSVTLDEKTGKLVSFQ